MCFNDVCSIYEGGLTEVVMLDGFELKLRDSEDQQIEKNQRSRAQPPVLNVLSTPMNHRQMSEHSGS